MNSTVHGREHYVTQQVTQLPVQNLKSMGKAWHGQSMHATWCVNAGALQGAGLGLQRSCTVMQVRERRLFSMQLVFTCALMCAQEHGRDTFGRIPLPPDSGRA